MELMDIEAFIEEGRYQYVRFEQPDLHGLSRSKTVPRRHFRRFWDNGLNFFGGLLGLDLQAGVAPGTGYMEERNFQDQLIWGDATTATAVPWADATMKVICEPYWYDGEPAKAGPRYLLRQMLERLDAMGFELRSSFEYEFYLVDAVTREPVFDGIQIFWTPRNDFNLAWVRSTLDSLTAAGIDILTSHVEYGPGQMEINYAPARGPEGADQAFSFRNGVKEMALQAGYMASFMTKPHADQSASGCHFHHSLVRKGSGINAFFEPTAQDGLSIVCHNWIGGQLAHARALTAIGAPTVNCGKRYKVNSFAPMNVTWGYEDRTAAVRIKGMRDQNTHIENRIPGAASNPYLVAAACLAAGIDGVINRTEPPPPTTGLAYADTQAPRLPETLDEALQALTDDTTLCDALGDEFIKLFTAVKRFEIEKAKAANPEYGSADWLNTVTDWERANLFEYL